MQGAGGVGGLLEVSYYGSSTTNCFPAFDGNGNLAALVNAADGTMAANYEYGPFGEVIRATGPMAKANPFRFSTKYQDDESDMLYYGHRYYKPSMGTWPSRDPIQEDGGFNIYGLVGGDCINKADLLGLEWVIERKNGFLATAYCTTPVDTFLDLANTVHLDYSDYKIWAHTSDDVPSYCKKYLVPNSIIIDFGANIDPGDRHEFNFLQNVMEANEILANRWWSEGYFCAITPSASSSLITQHLRMDGLYYYIWVGHGNGFGAINGDGNKRLPAVQPRRYTRYGIQQLRLWGCDTAQTVGGNHHLPNGWEKNVARVGGFMGFTEEVDLWNWEKYQVWIPGTNQR